LRGSVKSTIFTNAATFYQLISWCFVMNRTELIGAIAESAGITKTQADKALRATMENIQNTVASGGSLSLIGFGTFSSSQRAARQGKNPRTGEAINIAARKVARFSPGKGFRDLVNGGGSNGAKAKAGAKGGAAKGGAAKGGAAKGKKK
jgi:DNA-binding protein HU-beta